ncbi:MAG: type II toxin-antitoxin system Y4mF family antitoxin [Candidatus Omnitrophica bacterium]|nr:type II toxin-antitoxin system Y4mF family antitoxin [Candidatus Omnitrophota bacterium]MDD5430211.1 type II toxin-antitoxin system Y4mF family antitoxin [Candidatus Omnitrophota bacterium]
MRQANSNLYITNISFQIKKLRKSSGLTQVEFAKRAGVGLRFLRELETGKMTVRVDKLMQVLDFLGYHLELKRTEYQHTANDEKMDIK